MGKNNRNKIKLAVFDLAGTTVDYGSRAHLRAFLTAFARFGLKVTEAQSLGFMGMHKRDHIRRMLEDEEIQCQWAMARGREWTERDVEAVFNYFIPLQLACLSEQSQVIDGVCKTVQILKKMNIQIAVTTGYSRQMLNLILDSARKQGFVPDISCSSDEVIAGRPAPWMIFFCMEKAGISDPEAVIKIGDTISDIQAGLNAGVRTVGVAGTGSLIGLTKADFFALEKKDRLRLLKSARKQLESAGAHAVINDVSEMTMLVNAL